MAQARNATNNRRQNNKKQKDAPRSKEGRDLSRDFLDAYELANKFFTQTPLTRIDDKRTNETQNLLNLRLAYADPNSASFAGRRSSDMISILDRMKSGLEGYTAPELNAFREKSMRGMDSNLATSLNRMNQQQRMTGQLRGASMAQRMGALREDRENRNQLDQDLFIKNADERRSRLNEFRGATREAETDEFNRGQGALGSYETTLNTDTADRFQKQQINLGQEKADRAGEMAQKFGIMGLLQQMRQQGKQNKLMEQSIAKGIGGNAGGGGSSGYADALNSYIQQLASGQNPAQGGGPKPGWQ